jgi:class 3 adenylate cyclase
VTFLFTGIDEASRPWDEVANDMAAALRVYAAIVRGTIEHHGGYVFGIGGDAFSAAFASAADAMTAAIEAQDD